MSLIKLVASTLSLLVSFAIYASEPQGLFGIKLGSNISHYISKDYLDANKYGSIESSSGFFSIEITDKIHNKSPFVDWYIVTIDSNNIIQGVTGAKSIKSLEICLAQQGNLEEAFVAKYQLNFEDYTGDYPTFKIHSRYQILDNGDYLSLQCHLDYDDNSVSSQVYIYSKKRAEDIDAYYDSGI